MKHTFLSILASGLIAASAGAQSEKVPPQSNAYLLVFLDRRDKPIAQATIITKPFTKENHGDIQTTCKIEMADNSTGGSEVDWFKRMITKGGNRKVVIETRKNPDFGGGAHVSHVLIQFNPEVVDANITSTLNLDKDVPEGTWTYCTFAGGWQGGKVKVTRIQAEQNAAADRH